MSVHALRFPGCPGSLACPPVPAALQGSCSFHPVSALVSLKAYRNLIGASFYTWVMVKGGRIFVRLFSYQRNFRSKIAKQEIACPMNGPFAWG